MVVTLVAALLASASAKPWVDAPVQKERSGQPPPSIAALVKGAMPAVVGIIATTTRDGVPGDGDPFHDFLEKMYGQGTAQPHATPVRGIGTGFFIRSDGLIVTNGHVIDGASDITVQVGEDERVYRATLVGKDEPTDLALVKIEGRTPFPVLPLGDSDHLEVGEWVVAIGNPFGLSRSVTTGIVSYKGRRDVNPSGKPGYYDFIQTDAAINPGNSGGPLLDGTGAVIGINAAVNPTGQGIGFAIPISQLKEIGSQLATRGSVARSYMGVNIQDSLSADLAESFGVPGGRGVLITEVLDDGPAARAGMRPGDIVTSFEGEPIAESYRLRWLTGNTPPGKQVRLGIWRAGKALQLAMRLSAKPGAELDVPEPRPIASKSRNDEPFGFSVDDRTDAPGGVRVAAIDFRGPAFRAGLREGDLILEVDGKRTPDAPAFRRALASVDRSSVTRVYVRRGGRAIFFGFRSDPVDQPRRTVAR
jgi:Do/DeqQ family serine protease